MSVLDPAVQARIDAGEILGLELIRIDLPGKTVGYHRGGRPFTYNGLKYLPNSWLETGTTRGALGVAVTKRTIAFRNVPSSNPDDAIAKIEQYDYLNAPVIITFLAGDPVTQQPIGILLSTIYEIHEVRFPKGAMGKDGIRSITIEIDLELPGRSARGSTLIKVSPADHQFDNDPGDTCLEYVATNSTIAEEWGQRSG